MEGPQNMPNTKNPQIDVELAKCLITSQFPQWQHLPIKAVAQSGWDNRTFHLGNEMVMRLPSKEEYAPQILKEFQWLPMLARGLLIQITTPLALGQPCKEYPWHWSINQWIDGETTSIERVKDLNQFAIQLAQFLQEFQKNDSTEGPIAGAHNFYRGGPLATYDREMSTAIPLIQNEKDKHLAEQLWKDATSSFWQDRPVWVHGDIAVGNLLVKHGELCAVIDFGQLAIGDPACDLAIAWNFFTGESRDTFRTAICLDRHTWVRALGWTFWKTLCWPVKGTDAERIIQDVLVEYQIHYSTF